MNCTNELNQDMKKPSKKNVRIKIIKDMIKILIQDGKTCTTLAHLIAHSESSRFK